MDKQLIKRMGIVACAFAVIDLLVTVFVIQKTDTTAMLDMAKMLGLITVILAVGGAMVGIVSSNVWDDWSTPESVDQPVFKPAVNWLDQPLPPGKVRCPSCYHPIDPMSAEIVQETECAYCSKTIVWTRVSY